MSDKNGVFTHTHTVTTADAANGITFELGFIPTFIEILVDDDAVGIANDATYRFETGMTVRAIDNNGTHTEDSDAIVIYAGGTQVGYNNGSTPTFKDKDGTAVLSSKYVDTDGNRSISIHLPTLTQATNPAGTEYDTGQKFISKPGFTFHADNMLVSDVLFIKAHR